VVVEASQVMMKAHFLIAVLFGLLGKRTPVICAATLAEGDFALC
jgi:hypothetical protein